jgi:type IV pilus assembly protein PilA
VTFNWNAQAAGTGANSKFVDSILFNSAPAAAGQPQPANPALVITYNAGNVGVGAAANTLTLTPWMRTGAAGAGETAFSAVQNGRSGSLDWACASAGTVSPKNGITIATLGTMIAKYAPAQCR